MYALTMWTCFVALIAYASESSLAYSILAVLIILWCCNYFSDTRMAQRKAKKGIEKVFPHVINTAFLVKSCSRCYENYMGLTSISPNAKSIIYKCMTCDKKQYAAAASREAGKVKEFAKGYTSLVDMNEGEPVFYFMAVEAVMPYEETRRGTITKSMRAEVYRRDNGRCVDCGSKENLHYDHILPVAKGGSTVVENLQLLCQSCNLSKGARI